ncbi:MAG: hypothetical protein ACOYM3_19975 [Terrimicrobiaceae bacterium]
MAPTLPAASLLDALDAAQVESLRQGSQVLVLQEVAGLPWPRVRVFQKVKATPEEVAAVFFDYRNAKAFVPKVIKSDIARLLSPCVIEVDYGIDVPILPDEFYTARNTLKADQDGGYLVSWFLIKALQTKASEGSLRIERWNEGSVILYTNLVTPSSGMACLLKSTAIEQMRNTVRAIASRVEKQKAEHPEALKEEIQALQQALKKEAEGPDCQAWQKASRAELRKVFLGAGRLFRLC